MTKTSTTTADYALVKLVKIIAVANNMDLKYFEKMDQLIY